LMSFTSLCKTYFLYALVIILNRLISKVCCNFSLPISIPMFKTIWYKFYRIFFFFPCKHLSPKIL
jgi:hypothetical protein